jgi:RHS repeat-associated protein
MIQLPDASWIEYTYEGPFVKSVSRFTKEKKELYNHQVVSRDQMGHLLKEILIGCTGERRHSWDAAARRTEIVTDFFQDKVPEYDPLHNIKIRETVFNKEKYTIQYGYDHLFQIASEKGGVDCSYSYDSLGNRLQRDDSVYKINNLNQLLEAEGASYTFDGETIATKTVGEKTWIYQSNILGQLISIKDPDQNTVTFTYDLSGKRLTKRLEAAGKKAKIFRYFYLGQTELGCLDEKGNIVELKVPSDPNRPETATCVALEIKKEIYAPLYDLQGNIACLVDSQKRKIVESYRYSVFGEEEILNENGRVIADSAIGNPWRYQGKRVDKETGLIYFGQRYYDPKTGRWVSSDPAGAIDGPNLYTFAQNNPLTYVDHFGLTAEINEGWPACACGHCERSEFCHCTGSDPTHDIDKCSCRGIFCNHKMARGFVTIGSKITSALGGISHGGIDFLVGSLHGLQTMASHLGLEGLELTLQERTLMIEAVERSQANQMAAVEAWMMNLMSIDASDAVYQSFRSGTTMGLEVASLVTGAYGAVKGVIGFSKLARTPAQVAKIARVSTKSLKSGNNFFGNKGFQLRNAKYQKVRNSPTTIQGRFYGGHALDQMQNRGFTPSVVEETIQSGVGMPNKIAGRIQFYDPVNNISVIIEDGEIVTVMYGRID